MKKVLKKNRCSGRTQTAQRKEEIRVREFKHARGLTPMENTAQESDVLQNRAKKNAPSCPVASEKRTSEEDELVSDADQKVENDPIET